MRFALEVPPAPVLLHWLSLSLPVQQKGIKKKKKGGNKAHARGLKMWAAVPKWASAPPSEGVILFSQIGFPLRSRSLLLDQYDKSPVCINPHKPPTCRNVQHGEKKKSYKM